MVKLYFILIALAIIGSVWHHLPMKKIQLDHTYSLAIPQEGVYYGYYHSSLNSHPHNPVVKVSSDEKPSLTMYYQDWNPQEGQFDTRFMNTLSKFNVIPVVTWEPWIEKYQNERYNRERFSLKTVASGEYDPFIRDWAKNAAAYNKPLFLRFAHEMNGNWYPWGNVNTNTPEDYIKMWRHVHTIFSEEGATNVIWLWSPNNTDAFGNTESIREYYPGDRYVDWVGFSGFNWGNTNQYTQWNSFKELSRNVYTHLLMFNKPIMVTETSSVSNGGDKSEWFSTTLMQTIPSMPEIKGILFFDKNDGDADFSLSSGMDAHSIINDVLVNNPYYLKDPILVKQ